MPSSVQDDPQDYWEAKEVEKQLDRFDDAAGSGESMPMLVAVRLRPLSQKEADASDHNIVSMVESKLVVVLDPFYDAELNPNRAKEKRYAFDVVFNEEIGQEEVYHQTAQRLVGGVLDGYNCSVFAYGATGAGKTHTMLGDLESPGVMVNTLHDMFTRMKTDPQFYESKFKVTLCYMEIYNELVKVCTPRLVW